MPEDDENKLATLYDGWRARLAPPLRQELDLGGFRESLMRAESEDHLNERLAALERQLVLNEAEKERGRERIRQQDRRADRLDTAERQHWQVADTADGFIAGESGWGKSRIPAYRDGQGLPAAGSATGAPEATGLTSAIAYAQGMASTFAGNAASTEQWIASLEGNGGVSGPAVAAARQAAELQQQSAAAWKACADALGSHTNVREAYQASRGAGTREFVLND